MTDLFDLDGASDRLIVVKINATSDVDAKDAVQTLVSQHGIDRLDTVIANAGIFDPAANQKVADMKLTDLQEHVDVNAYGAIRLFQATWPLLEKSRKPVFLLNSAGAASIGGLGSGSGILPRFPLVSYAASKLLANFFTLRLKYEHPKLISFAVHPGSVITPNRTAAAKKLGVPVEGLSVDESVSKLLSMVCTRDLGLDYGRFGLLPLLIQPFSQLDNATLGTTSGTFLDIEGPEIPW